MKKFIVFLVIAMILAFIVKNLYLIAGIMLILWLAYIFFIKPGLEADEKENEGPQAK